MATSSQRRRPEPAGWFRSLTLAPLFGLSSAGCGLAAAKVPEALAVCVAVARDAERLRCYDRAVAALAAGDGATSLEVTPEEVFGAADLDPTARAAIGDVRREELDSISAKVRSVERVGERQLMLYLENGQVWRQDEEKSLQIDAGDTVRISRAALGTFRVVDARGRFARFKRVR